MVEILDVGSEAETQLMAGRGMNGLRGTIVCYNTSNQRYTLELGSGEMLSLRGRNVKAVVASSPEDELEEGNDKNGPSKTKNENVTVKEEEKAIKSPTSGLPKFEDPLAQDDDDVNPVNAPAKGGGNFIDNFIYGIFNAILDLSPSAFLIVAAAAFYIHKWMNAPAADSTGNSGGGPEQGPRPKHYYYDCDEYGYCYDRPYYGHRWGWSHWHWHSWHYYWGYFSFSGLFSVVVLSFFMWQFGTKKGRVAFRWRHVQDRVAQFDFWEVVRYAAILEGAFFFLSRVAGGGRRR